jgi:hypothetical protein
VIGLGRRVPVYAFGEAVDMRKSFDTLSAIVREHIKQDVLDGALYVFVGKDRRRAKVRRDQPLRTSTPSSPACRQRRPHTSGLAGNRTPTHKSACRHPIPR